jgi:hypothetical protein
MAIKTNHTTESIKPASNVLTIDAKGALALPSGKDTDRPTSPLAGHVRFDQTSVKPEYYSGAEWEALAALTYVDAHDLVLQTQIDYIKSNVDPAAIDSLTEIVQNQQNVNLNFADVISNLSLDSLTDTTINSPSAGQVLSFDAVSGQFRNQTHQLSLLTKNYYGNGVVSTFELLQTVASPNNLVVSINGIVQQPNYSYTVVNGTTLAFDETPESGDLIEVRILRSTVTNDRPRPTITAVSYGTIAQYTTITIEATDITFGTGARIGGQAITRIDYPTANTMQLMVQTNRVVGPLWSYPQDLTLVDTSGNEFVFTNLINFGQAKPYWTNSNSYIGSFSGGDTINFTLSVNNATSITIQPANAGESAISWLTVSGTIIVGTAPQNSSPSRYEIKVTAGNGSVDITKNYWLLVI